MVQRRLNYKFEEHKSHLHAMRYKSLLGNTKQALPSLIDLRGRMSPIEDQGDEGSCSGHGSAACVEQLEILEMHKQGPQVYDPGKFVPVSRNFIYWGERTIEGSTKTDAGATTLRDACVTLNKVGVCREPLWPYNKSTLFQHPSLAAYADAAKHKIPHYYALDAGYQLRHCLSSGFAFMFGFMVPAAMMEQQMAASGQMPLSDWMNGKFVGGHAVACVGYNDATQNYWVRNSWGPGWGLHGYFLMPYDFMDSQFVDDFYTLRLDATNNP